MLLALALGNPYICIHAMVGLVQIFLTFHIFLFRCVLSWDLLICQSGKRIHSVKFSQNLSNPFTLELSQPIDHIQPTKSGNQAGVIVSFESSQLSQVVLFSESGQTSVQCKALSTPTKWVFYDGLRESHLLLGFEFNNQVIF